MIEIRLYMIEKYKEANMALAQALGTAHGGLTTIKGDGLWYSEAQNKMMHDKVIIASCFIRASEQDARGLARSYALGYLAAVKEEEAMLVTVDGKGYIVEMKDVTR